MFNHRNRQHTIAIDLDGAPITEEELITIRGQLKAEHRDHLHYIFALCVLAIGVTIRALNIDFEQLDELLKISLNIGMWIGLFTGFVTAGDRKHKFHLILVSIVVSVAASFFTAMLLTLSIGYIPAWIASINILASALSCMWILTTYDNTVTVHTSLRLVNAKQLVFMKKAVKHFHELENFGLNFIGSNRRPLLVEYWAIRDWLDKKKG